MADLLVAFLFSSLLFRLLGLCFASQNIRHFWVATRGTPCCQRLAVTSTWAIKDFMKFLGSLDVRCGYMMCCRCVYNQYNMPYASTITLCFRSPGFIQSKTPECGCWACGFTGGFSLRVVLAPEVCEGGGFAAKEQKGWVAATSSRLGGRFTCWPPLMITEKLSSINQRVFPGIGEPFAWASWSNDPTGEKAIGQFGHYI